MPFLNEGWGIITISKLIYSFLIFSTVLISYMIVNAFRRNVLFHEITADSAHAKDRSLTLFFISDVHRRKIDNNLLQKIKNEIDIVIIGGDLTERGVPLKRISKNVENLSSLAPIYFIWGNNDREVGEIEIRKIIARYNGKILDNENTTFPGHPTWGILGTDDPSNGSPDIAATLRNVDCYEKTILVTHTPSLFRKVELEFQPDLMLAGHTHGGQIRIGKFGLFEKGSFIIDGNRAKLISNGFGTTSLPLRLGADSECHVIKVNY
ncbi:metallophosphoesterase [Sporosarcina sp. FA9]|uniref:metallophosphoesterase n=1 Tax=Sporosarcina sp. FA9 TaxID=3413030 RepID=UPI003F65A35D